AEWSALYQQRPTSEEGAIIKREYWQRWDPPDGKFPPLEYVLASADTAYTEKEENDPTGFVIIGLWRDKDRQPKIMLLNAWRKRLEIIGMNTQPLPNETDAEWRLRTQERWGLTEWIAHSCRRFKVHKLIIEAKASGLSVAQAIRKLQFNEGWGIETVSPEGDKVARAYAVQPIFADGLVYAPDREWAQMVIDEMAAFPKGTYKDLTDACLAPETGIVTARGVVPSKDVAVGALVFTHKGRWRKVIDVGSRKSDHYYRLKANGLDEIRITGEHPALTMRVGIVQKPVEVRG